MKLILKQYLSSLRERGELDAILPDLLSQMGLNVYSRPGRGTRQDGVDVGAVGSLDGGPEKVYLFSIKPGNLSRRDWDGDSDQSLRPSLNLILDAYIPNRLPEEHRSKDIVICIGIGGDVQEQVRPELKGYLSKNKTDQITFEEWNGDKISELIQSNFLREDLLPEHARSLLRKSLALLDEPEVSFRHFSALIKLLSDVEGLKNSDRVTAIRQISICLWILFSWARDAENMESAYLSGELALLHSWNIAKRHWKGNRKPKKEMETAFTSIFSAYRQICDQFLSSNVIPHVGKLHAISSAIRPSCSLDVNLKLFDLLGRLGIAGVWGYWWTRRISDEDAEVQQQVFREYHVVTEAIKHLIINNPTLLLPIKDDQAIDLSIASWSLGLSSENHNDIRGWFGEMLNRADFAYRANGQYPCNLNSYSDLLMHPKRDDEKYLQEVTSGSILYPMIALWAALLDDKEMYDKVGVLNKELLEHCNFQLWYPDGSSEDYFYSNKESHGAVLSHVCVGHAAEELLEQVFGECDRTSHFEDLSAAKFDWWPLIFIACRHYRLPLPIQLMKVFRGESKSED